MSSKKDKEEFLKLLKFLGVDIDDTSKLIETVRKVFDDLKNRAETAERKLAEAELRIQELAERLIDG